MASPPRAFISYRREDTKEVARALHSELDRVLDVGTVFLDHREIEPGASFPGTLANEIERADIVLVLVGPKWLTLQSSDGVRRLDEPDDYVRKEIELALERHTPIVPVLVDNAAPLTKRAFRTVPSIEGLADLQSIPLTTLGWQADFEAIVELLETRGFRRGDSTLRIRTGASSPGIFRSTIPARGNRPFVGRVNLLAEMERLLGSGTPPQFLALCGEPGVGKSELAREFARIRQGHYPGGTFNIDASTGGLPVDLATVGSRILQLRPTEHARIEDQCVTALLSFGSAPTLLIYDNVLSPDWTRGWLPPAGMACHVIVTSQASRWDDRWHTLRVLPLDDRESRELIEAVAGGDDLREHVAELVRASGGLPVQILPAARSLLLAARAGRPGLPVSRLSDETRSSFESAWARLPEEGRGFLMAAALFHPDRIDAALLREILTEQPGWSEKRARAGLDACRDLFLVAGEETLQIHRLFARFVRDERRTGDLRPGLRHALWPRLLEAADAVQQQPGSAERALRLLAFDPSVELWIEDSASGADVSVEAQQVASALSELGRFQAAQAWGERAVAEAQKGDAQGRVDPERIGSSLHHVGFCLFRTGKYDAARPWFERAVAEKQQGDVQGRVDRASLGASLHLVGDCLVGTGQYDAARPWFERAVSEKQKRDVHGRLDATSLGVSLHQVGHCLVGTGRYDAARPWFERAVAEKQKGDVHGRLDPVSLGNSLHQVGFCLAGTGRYDEACPWFERAVAEKQKGDVHGRLDATSLGASLHLVGDCLFRTGQYDAALPWFERAAGEIQKGDVYGRIDPEKLGLSLHQVGYCLVETGRYDAARSWFERAVAEKQKGDVHGHVDPASLAASVHQVGYCLFQTGQYEEARPWFERAVAEAQKGDAHGRVDPERLGASLHQVGICLFETGRYDEARPWFEGAVAEARKGDVHGRVDPVSLGTSLHRVGYCLFQTGQYDEARSWFERAIAEVEKGDVHGRVDPDRLGTILHRVGSCLVRTGQHDEARGWFERAVAEKQKGDVHGRVDAEGLGTSLHEVGNCLLHSAQYDGARRWFERAVAEKQRGNVHGRVDSVSLGTSLHQVGYCLAQTGQDDQAQRWFQRAVVEKQKGDVHGRADLASLRTSEEALWEAARRRRSPATQQ